MSNRRMPFPATKLCIRSRSRTLTFRVKDVIGECYDLSQNFIARYQALYELMSVIAYDDALPPNMRTPVKERTVHWLVESHIKLAPRNSKGAEPSDPRSVHGSTVRSIFAPHAEWLKREVIDKKGFINKTSWNRFCEEYRARKAAKRRGMDTTQFDESWGEEKDLMEIEDTNGEEHDENPEVDFDMITGYTNTVS